MNLHAVIQCQTEQKTPESRLQDALVCGLKGAALPQSIVHTEPPVRMD